MQKAMQYKITDSVFTTIPNLGMVPWRKAFLKLRRRHMSEVKCTVVYHCY